MDTDQRHRIYDELVARLLEGRAHASPERRRVAFGNAGRDEPAVRTLVRKVAVMATELTNDDFTKASAAGLSEDEVWETIICAAVGQARSTVRRGVGGARRSPADGADE